MTVLFSASGHCNSQAAFERSREVTANGDLWSANSFPDLHILCVCVFLFIYFSHLSLGWIRISVNEGFSKRETVVEKTDSSSLLKCLAFAGSCCSEKISGNSFKQRTI